MKKWVAKEDVENGLVDPKKPLSEQKEYLEKIEKKEQPKEEHVENERNTKKKYRQSKYNWDRRTVNLQTPVPELPKKQLPKPNKDKFYEEHNAMKKQVEQLNKKKFDLIEEMRQTMRNTNDSKKNTRTVKNKFSSLLGERHALKKSLFDQVHLLEQKRDEIEGEINRAKQRINALKKPQNFENCSQEQLQKRLEKIEHRLITDQLTKKQENQINLRIAEIKRAMLKARSEGELNVEVKKLYDQNEILYNQSKQIRARIDQKYTSLKQLKAEITKLNEELGNEKTEPVDTRSSEQIKADYDKKIESVGKEKQELKQKIDKHREQFNKKVDEYEEYDELVSYIKMIKEEKQKIKRRQQEEERRRKQRQEQEKRRQKERQERERRKQQKIKRDEQRKKQQEEKKQKLKKEKQQFINRNPFFEQIGICDRVLQYCEDLRPENSLRKVEKREQKVIQPLLDLNPKENKEWEKEIKKGAQIIVSKKLRDEEEAKQQDKKKKKKEKQPTELSTSAFTHHIDIIKLFEKINLLPPLTVSEIDQTVKQINQKLNIFNKPSEQDIAQFKERAAKQFDELNGLSDGGKRAYKEKGGQENHGNHHYQQKNNEHKEKGDKYKTKKMELVANEKEFPGLE